MTMKDFRKATMNVPDDADLIIDHDAGDVTGESDVFTIIVRTSDACNDGDINISVVVS